MESKTDLNADKMLKEVYDAYHRGNGGAGYGYMFDYYGNQYNSVTGSQLAKMLHEHKLVNWMGYPDDSSKDMMYIEDRGEEIQRTGGWIAHLNRMRANSKEKLPHGVNKKHIQLAHAGFNTKSTKENWFVKYWWAFFLPLIIGIILLAIEHGFFTK